MGTSGHDRGNSPALPPRFKHQIRMQPLRPLTILGIALLLGGTGCTDPFGPDRSGPIYFDGDGASDTIGAILESGLAIGTTVGDGVQAYMAAIEVPCPQFPPGCSSLGVRPADAEHGFGGQGEIIVWKREPAELDVKLGIRAGRAGLVVFVPILGIADTAFFTVRPGAPADIRWPLAESAVAVGSTFAIGATVVDRAGNVREEDEVTVLAPSTALAVDGDSATALTPGHVRVRLVSESLAIDDSIRIFPDGDFFAVQGSATTVNYLIRMPLVGGAIDTVLAVDSMLPGRSRQPGGSLWSYSVESSMPAGDGKVASLWVAEPGGSRRRLAGNLHEATQPYWSGDGQFIYFSGRTSPDHCNSIWSVPLAGGDAAPVLAVDGHSLTTPTVSDDGSVMAYLSWPCDGIGPNQAIVLDRRDGQSRLLSNGVSEIAIAPDGRRVAYRLGSTIWVASSDGSNDRVVSPRGVFGSLDWSPDGDWLISRGSMELGQDLVLIRVSDGLAMAIDYGLEWDGGGSYQWE